MLFKDKFMKERQRAEGLQVQMRGIVSKKKDFMTIMQNCVAEVKRDLYYKKFMTQDKSVVENATGETRKLLITGQDELVDQDQIDSKVFFYF